MHRMTSAAPPAPDTFSDTQPGGPEAGDALDLDLGALTPEGVGPVVRPSASPPAAFLVASAPVAEARTGDSTLPMGLLTTGWLVWRVLVVSNDENERMYLRARLALSNLVKVDEALSTPQAIAALSAREYTLVFVNDDSAVIDAPAVAATYRSRNRLGSLVLTTASLEGRHPLNLMARWRDWKLRQHLGDARFTRLMAKPLSPPDVQEVLQDWARVHVH